MPSDSEWTKLTDYVGGSSTAGTKLKAKSGWNAYSGGIPLGTDDYGFSALPGGNGYWWSATENGAGSAYSRSMYYNIENVYSYNYDKDDNLFSVRCLKD